MANEKRFEVDKLEERIAPSVLSVGTLLDHAATGNAIASGNNVGIDAGHNDVSFNPTVSGSVSVDANSMVQNILNDALGSQNGSGDGTLGL